MRKTFLTFCAAALALLAVSSCGKLEDGLNSLKGEVADLKDRVEKLEKKLNDEVQALQATMATLATKQEMNTALANLQTSLQNKDSELATAIQNLASKSELASQAEALAALLGEKAEELEADYLAKIAEAVASVTVTVVEDQNGSVVITLANGQSFTVAKDANVNNTGLVTVDEDGNWAVILEDGTLKSLDAQVGVEELEFQVDPETKELLYSVNGGEFEGTGAYASDADYTVVTDCHEDEDFFYICVGGVEYALVKATTSTTDLNLLAGKTYFENGQTKVVNFTVTDVKSAFVASAPKGWDVELDFAKNTLTVTAPAEGEGATEGNVEVWLLGNDGVVKAAFLPVVCGPAVITIDVDPQTNAVAMTFNQMMIEDYDGTVAMRTPEVYYGATLASEFPAKKAEYLANLAQLVWDPTSGVYTNCNSGNPDNYDLRATSFEGNVADLAYNVNYSAEYVVWAFIPEWTEDWEVVNPNDFVVVYHQMNAVNFESEASLSDAELSIEFLDPNVIGFYGIYLPESYRDSILENLESGEWTLEGHIFSGMFGTEVPCCYYESSSLEVKMSEFGWAADWIAEGDRTVILPVSTSTLCLVPVYEGKVEYAYEDIILKEVKTQDVSLGSSLEYTVTENVDYTSFTVNVVCADAVFAMYYIYNTAKVVVPETDQDVLDMLSAYYIPQPFMYGMYSGSMSIEHRASYGEEPGTEYEFVLVLIDENAKVVVERKTITTKVLPLNNNLTVAVEAYIDDLSEKSTAKFTVGEGAKKLYYTCNTGTTMDIDSQIEILNNESDWEVIELTDDATTYTVEGFKVKTYSWMDVTNYVHAILVDEEGNVSRVFTSAGFNVKKGFQQ